MQNFIKKLCSRYTLYLLCFMAFNLIEWTMNTQPGYVWYVAVNCTGLVMMVLVFSQLPLRDFLKPINYIYTAICIVALGLLYWYWTGHIGEYIFGQMATVVMNVWWLGLAVPCLFRRVIEKRDSTPAGSRRMGALGWTWIAFTVWTIISVSDKWWPLWFLLMFGAFYFTSFSEERKDVLLDAMMDGTIASFFVMQSHAFLFRPFDMPRYVGGYVNSNRMGLYYLVIYCMVLCKIHLLHARKARWGWKLFYLLGAGVLLSFQLLTASRAAWGCSAAVTICYGLAVLRRAWGDTVARLAARGCILVLTTIAAFPLVFLAVRWLPTIHPHPVWYLGEYSPGRVHSWDPPDSEKYTELDEILREMLGRFYVTFPLLEKIGQPASDGEPQASIVPASESDAAPASEPAPASESAAPAAEAVALAPEPEAASMSGIGVSLASEPAAVPELIWDVVSEPVPLAKFFSTGREEIWQMFLKYANWMGHGEQEGLRSLEQQGYGPQYHTHNLWIQALFLFGYPGGALFALLSILLFVKVIRRAGDIAEDPYAAVPLIIAVAYFLYGTVESDWYPGQLIMTLMFVVMHPQFTGKSSGNPGESCQS